MYPAIFLGEFFLLLNTAPLNAAILNSVSAPIRSTAFAVNIFTIHLLGDAFSPSLMGYISDRSNMQMAFVAASAAIAISAGVLFLGVRYAPQLPQGEREHERLAYAESAVGRSAGRDLAAITPLAARRGMRQIADLSQPEYAVASGARLPRVSIIVPARNEAGDDRSRGALAARHRLPGLRTGGGR